MSIFNHNIYDNVRTRVIVLHERRLLLHPPQGEESAWKLPGGGLTSQESLAECAIREVFEETGIHIRVSSIAFLREWVVPKYCIVPNSQEQGGFGLEIYLYGYPINEKLEPRPEHPDVPAARWIRLGDIPNLPLWPKELKALASALLSGSAVCGVQSFVSQLESPWETPSEPVIFNLRVETQ